MTFLRDRVLRALRVQVASTKSRMPPRTGTRRVCVSPRSSLKMIFRPLVRKAISRKRCSSVVVVVLDRLEDLEVRQERDARAAPVGLLALGERAGRGAALVALRVLVAVAPDREVERLGERVDDGHADAVQAAGDLVAAAVAELAAGVEDGEHDLGGRLAAPSP